MADGAGMESVQVVMAEDILQQALEEVSGGFEHSIEAPTITMDGSGAGTSYALVNIADGQQVTLDGVNSLQTEDGTLHAVEDVNQIFAPEQYVGLSNGSIITTSGEQQYVQMVEQPEEEPVTVSVPSTQVIHAIQQPPPQPPPPPPAAPPPPQPVIEPKTARPSNSQLGTSSNPIRIIQQGNQYTSMQQLTPDQLSQIMQVLQQQQLLKSTEREGSSVLFNPQTQTRIVYKVIQPSQLHGSANSTATKAVRQIQVPTSSVVVPTGPIKKNYRKRKHEDDDKQDGLLPKEEREARKKRKLRTRSGRISRPPKHMVKDYKHIHPVDFNDDPYDDSDGGYSDFRLSDTERDKSDHRYTASYAFGSTKPKNWKCETCEKAYIGRAGLARHYRIYPDHGKLDLEEEYGEGVSLGLNGIESGESRDSSITMQPPVMSPASSIGINGDRTEKVTAKSEVKDETAEEPESIQKEVKEVNEPKTAAKTKQHYEQKMTAERRRRRLKEVMGQCSEEELLEVVMPRLANYMSLFEFLLMKAENQKGQDPSVPTMLKDYEAFNSEVKAYVSSHIQLKTEEPGEEKSADSMIQVNESLSLLLGLPTGSYEVINKQNDIPFQYNLLTTEPQPNRQNDVPHRQVVVVSQEEMTSQVKDKREEFLNALSLSNGLVNNETSTATDVKYTNAQTPHTYKEVQVPMPAPVVASPKKTQHMVSLINGNVIEQTTTDVTLPVQQTHVVNQEEEEEAVIEPPEPEPARILQTDNGLILIQNQDGTIQIHGETDGGIPVEIVQALLQDQPLEPDQINVNHASAT